LKEKDIRKIAKYIGITKTKLISLVNMKKIDETLLEELKTITTIDEYIEFYTITPFGGESEMATLMKLYYYIFEKLKPVKTVEQVKKLYEEAKTDFEQDAYIWEIYKRF